MSGLFCFLFSILLYFFFSLVGKTYVQYILECNNFEVHYITSIIYYAIIWQIIELLIRYLIFIPTKFYDKFFTAEDKLACSTKIISLLHAVVSSYLALTCVARHWDVLPTPAFPWRKDFADVLLVSLGYFVYDIFVYIRYYFVCGKVDKSMVVHHVMCLFAFCYTIFMRVGLFDTVALLATEVTTPLLQIRWYLLKLNMEHTKVYKWNGMLFAVGFLVFRIILNSLVCFHIYYYANDYAEVPWSVRSIMLLGYVLLGLNLFWFSAIIKLVMKSLGKKSTEKKE